MSIRIYSSNFKGTGYDIFTFNKNIVKIGRSSDNDLVMRDGDVSRKHAIISILENNISLEDCESLNGTLIYEDGEWIEVEGKRPIKLPAIVILGVNVLIKIEAFTEEHEEYHEGTKISQNPTSIIETMIDKENQEVIMVLDLCDSTKISNINEKLGYQLKIRLNQIAMPVLFKHNLNFFKGTGDGFLVTFKKIKNAIMSSNEIVELLIKENAKTKKPLMNFRIALHYGKTYVTGTAGTDIHGNDVNITFRLEGLKTSSFMEQKCELPDKNRILCSREFYEQIKNTELIYSLTFKYCGKAQVKGIEEPIEVYSLTSSSF